METNIVFLESDNDFAPKEKLRIWNIVEESAECAGGLLVLYDVINVTIYPFVIHGPGKPWVTGTAKSKDWIELIIPPNQWSEDDLMGTVFHELHHLVRGHTSYTKSGERIRLMGSIFSEGLATVFEIENVPGRVPPYALYNVSTVRKWLPKLKEEMDSRDYDYDAWFFKNGRNRWMGYKIGKYLVDQIKKNRPDLNSALLVKVGAKKLLQLSGVEL